MQDSPQVERENIEDDFSRVLLPVINKSSTSTKMLEFNPRQKVIMASGFAMTDRIKEALKQALPQHYPHPGDAPEAQPGEFVGHGAFSSMPWL